MFTIISLSKHISIITKDTRKLNIRDTLYNYILKSSDTKSYSIRSDHSHVRVQSVDLSLCNKEYLYANVHANSILN